MKEKLRGKLNSNHEIKSKNYKTLSLNWKIKGQNYGIKSQHDDKKSWNYEIRGWNYEILANSSQSSSPPHEFSYLVFHENSLWVHRGRLLIFYAADKIHTFQGILCRKQLCRRKSNTAVAEVETSGLFSCLQHYIYLTSGHQISSTHISCMASWRSNHWGAWALSCNFIKSYLFYLRILTFHLTALSFL